MRKTIKQKLIDQMSPEWGNQAWTFDRIKPTTFKPLPKTIMFPRYVNMTSSYLWKYEKYNWKLMQRTGMVSYFSGIGDI